MAFGAAAGAATAGAASQAAAGRQANTGPAKPVGSNDTQQKVLNAVNIRGSKGEHVNSFMRAQFADFDYKDTTIIVDNANPEYNLSFEQSFNIDETLIEIFANKLLILTLIESLPKEKTAQLGTVEVSLYKPFLKYFTRDPEVPDAPIPTCPLVYRENLPIVYANPKLLAPSPESLKSTPECTLEVVLSRPLLRPDEIMNGNFVAVRVEDVYPVPDEWTTKEGNEKDLNSNLFTYMINITLPSENGGERIVSVPNGTLVACEAPVTSDPSVNVPQTVTISDLRREQGKSESSASLAGLNPSQTAEEPDGDAVDTKETKKVVFGSSLIIYLSPTVVECVRKYAQEKRPLEVEPKFASVVDTYANKYRGRAAIEVSMMMFPNIIGIKDPNNVYRMIGSAITMDFMLSMPLIDKKKLQMVKVQILQVIHPQGIYGLWLIMHYDACLFVRHKYHQITKTVSDFIPKRHVPPNLLFEKRSKQAEDDYRTKINQI
eukprot:jgi/Hompol1/89/HPOL_005219-RA